MDSTDGSIHAQKPASFLPQRVNLKGLFSELTKGSLKIGSGNPWAALPDALAALTHIGTLTESQRAYTLVYRGLIAAIVELVQEVQYSLPKQILAESVFDKALEDPEFTLAPDFLERPREVAVLPRFQTTLEAWLLERGLEATKAKTTAARLPSYFALALHEEWTRHSEFFAPIQKMLSGPLAKEPRTEWAWHRYRQELMQAPEKRLFEENFGLRSVFVPLRGHWKETIKTETKEHPLLLDEALQAWFTKAESGDSLRVISGDPGSGKSSCAKMWAAELARVDPTLRVVLVQLHLFAYKGELREGLRAYLREHCRIEADVLEKGYDQRVVLFFDGLDELAMQGKSAREAAVSFVREVQRLLDVVNAEKQRVWVVLGGRQIVVQDCGGELRNARQILHLEPYDDAQRTLWWQQYGAASGQGYTSLPEQLRRDDLDPITVQPLLNYLVALSYDRKKLDFTKPVTINQIYADILDRVYNRVWGEGKNIHLRGMSATLPQEDFEQLLEEIGVAVWHGDSRSATLEIVRKRCDEAGLSDVLKNLESDTDTGLFRLLTAFHFRFTDSDKGSVEFTHKSFGEYLTARRIVRLVEDITEERSRNQRKRTQGMTVPDALVAWCQLCGPSALDATDLNLFEMVKNEVKERDDATRTAWEQVLIEMFDEMVAQGMPMEKCGLETYREMDVQSRNAEEALLCLLSTCLSPQTRQKKTANKLASPLVARLHFRNDLSRWNLAAVCTTTLNQLGYIFLHANLSVSNLSGANLRGAYLGAANLTGAHLQEADLTGASLQEADLTGANLFHANLTGASLRGATLSKVQYWKYTIGLDLRKVPLHERPVGWQEFFQSRGWKIEDIPNNEGHTVSETRANED